jgi:hypothetical protein
MRYNEHKLAFRNNSHTSKFVQQLNVHAHSFGTIHDTMQILHNHKKSAHLNTLKRYYINAEYTYADNNHLNDNHTIFPNDIFDTLQRPTLHKAPLPPRSHRRSHTPIV